MADTADGTQDPFDIFFNLEDTTSQNMQEGAGTFGSNPFLEPMGIDAKADPYETYRALDNDFSGLPIISSRMTPSAANIWLSEDLISSPVPLTPRFAFEASDLQGSDPFTSAQQTFLGRHQSTSDGPLVFNSIHKDLASTKRKAIWVDDGVTCASQVATAINGALQLDHTQVPMPKRQMMVAQPESPARTISYDCSIRRVLDKKKGKWLVEYIADTKTGPALKTKWLNWTQAKRIPQNIKDTYHKGAWQKIADKIEQNQRDR